MKKLIAVISFGFLCIISYAQEADTALVSRENALNVYFDCDFCDMTYFRQNFTLINYVRDRKVADVQIIVTTMDNGGGGIEFKFQFVGLGKFDNMTDTITFNTKADATSDEIREMQLSVVKRGLAPFILKTPFADKVQISYTEEKEKIEEKDPWNNWVFNINADGYFNGQKSYKSMHVFSSASASRITEEIKHETSFDFNYSENQYKLYNNNDSLIYSASTYMRGVSFEHRTTWSMGDHWGSGVSVDAYQSTYSNIAFGASVGPAVEYNVFKYSEASQKQLRFSYMLSAGYRDYVDTTIYNKTEEFIFRQSVEVNFKYITKWGSVRTGVYWRNYLHDFKLYSVSTYVGTQIRIFKGLSFNLYGNLSMPRNQIGLVKSETTPEDVLLHQRELETQYSYYTSVGLSYTFGSIYNNVVNPRLD
jgi:hypothetical protein